MTDAERQRLAAILGMLGSDHAGERDSAARQAEAFRKKHGLTWAELLALSPTLSEPEPTAPPPPPPSPGPAAPPRPKTHWADLQLLVFAISTSAALYSTKLLMH